jgi:hypothetical protein
MPYPRREQAEELAWKGSEQSTELGLCRPGIWYCELSGKPPGVGCCEFSPTVLEQNSVNTTMNLAVLKFNEGRSEVVLAR